MHGTEEATAHLANFCEQAGWASGRVHTPRVGETVNVRSETHIFEVCLCVCVVSWFVVFICFDYEGEAD